MLYTKDTRLFWSEAIGLILGTGGIEHTADCVMDLVVHKCEAII